MARQRKTLPARRQQANDDSLLIRSAESLGRMIGSLQRQLDAARRLTGSAPVNARGNGHAPVRANGAVTSKAKKTKRTLKTAASRSTAAHNRPTAGRGKTKTTRRT
jgi:hypothetical protein